MSRNTGGFTSCKDKPAPTTSTVVPGKGAAKHKSRSWPRVPTIPRQKTPLPPTAHPEQQLREPPPQCGQNSSWGTPGLIPSAAGGEAQGAGRGVWLGCRNRGARPCPAYTRALHNAAPRQVSSGRDGHTSKPRSRQSAGLANPPLVTPAPLTLLGGSWGKVAQPRTPERQETREGAPPHAGQEADLTLNHRTQGSSFSLDNVLASREFKIIFV